MIIDKRKKFWTDQDEQERDEAEEQRKLITTAILERRSPDNDPEKDAVLQRLFKEFEEAVTREDEIYNRVLERYYKGRGKKQLLADAEEVINAVEKEDYQQYRQRYIRDFLSLPEEITDQGTRSEISDFFQKRAQENYENCFRFISRMVVYQIEGLHRLGDDQSKEKIKTLIDKRVSLWYVNKNPTYVNIYHEKGLDTLPYMNPKNAVIDDISKTLSIEKQGAKLEILDFEKLGGAPVTISAHKLLMKAREEFTKQNSAGTGKINHDVIIPLKEYAEALGYDIAEKYTATPEEAEKERKRVKNQLDNVRKAIKGDLKRLHSFVLTTEDTIRGKTRRIDNYSIVSHTGYSNGKITITFAPQIAKVLVNDNLITKFPTALYRISGENPNAYPIGCKLAEHYHMYNNRVKGTNKNISVKAILESSQIVTFEEVQKKDRGHWEARIKEPMETALDSLTKQGVITDWKYIHAGGVDLSDEEARNISTYKDFINLYIHYEMPDPGDEERIKEKREQRQKAIARKKQAKKKQG